MASDLGSAPTGGLDDPLARAASEQNSQLAGEPMTLSDQLQRAAELGSELDFNRGHFPTDGSSPSLPSVNTNAGNVFEGVDFPSAPSTPAPSGGGGGGGDGGGDGGDGGGGGGGGGSDLPARVEEYLQRRSDQRARVERFLRDNPGDYDRMPSALELPDW
jgi:hypothetical protein